MGALVLGVDIGLNREAVGLLEGLSPKMELGQERGCSNEGTGSSVGLLVKQWNAEGREGLKGLSLSFSTKARMSS